MSITAFNPWREQRAHVTAHLSLFISRTILINNLTAQTCGPKLEPYRSSPRSRTHESVNAWQSQTQDTHRRYPPTCRVHHIRVCFMSLQLPKIKWNLNRCWWLNWQGSFHTDGTSYDYLSDMALSLLDAYQLVVSQCRATFTRRFTHVIA